MVAALQRSDDLAGVEVSLSVPRDVDGPGASGMVCLALLSALDGKKLPHDFAFTGSVLPDGTIGPVVGLVERIAVAKGRGVTRVLVPDCIRFEADLSTDELIDLKELATSQELEFVPVRNIEQAYRVVHRTAPRQVALASETLSALPPTEP